MEALHNKSVFQTLGGRGQKNPKIISLTIKMDCSTNEDQSPQVGGGGATAFPIQINFGSVAMGGAGMVPAVAMGGGASQLASAFGGGSGFTFSGGPPTLSPSGVRIDTTPVRDSAS
jgi:hypothetical protein